MIVADILDSKNLPSLKKFRETGDFNNIPNEYKEGLVLLESYSGNANFAEVLYDKFKICNEAVLARLHYLCGNLVEAEALARSCKDVYLLCEILICRNEFDQAFSLLQDAPFENLWFYYAGILYTLKGQPAKAQTCLEKANTLFSQNQEFLPRLMVLSNLANSYNQTGEVKKASRIINELILLTKSIDRKQFPRLCAKLYIDIGFFLMQTGQLKNAFRYLKQAERLIGANRSEEFYRVKIFLGYTLKQMGYYKKAIDIFLIHIPSVNYLNLDRLRYLAECYTKLGDFDKSDQVLAQGFEICGDDKYAKLFFCLCSYENQFLRGNRLEAEKTFDKVKMLCQEMDDSSILTFALGKRAYLTKDGSLSTGISEALINSGFLLEASECHLAVGYGLLAEDEYERALTHLDQFEFSSFPIQRLESLILKAVCLINLEQKQKAAKMLVEAKVLAQPRDLRLSVALIQLVEIYTSTEIVSLAPLYSKYLVALHVLSTEQIRQLEAIKSLLSTEKILIKAHAMTIEASQVQLAEMLSIRDQIVLDLDRQAVFLNGNLTQKLAEFPMQWNLLYALATTPQPLSKEMVVKQVLGRTSYDPLLDDNNVNVTIHRLRANLKKLLGVDPIVTRSGTYLIDEKFRIVAFQRKRRREESKVS